MLFYPHVIFDLDGTLLNTIDDLADAGNWVCRRRGWPEHTAEEYKTFVGSGIPRLVERFTPEKFRTPALLSEVLSEFSRRYDAHKEDKTAPYPGVADAVRALREAGVVTAVLSNKAHPMAQAVVERYFPGLFCQVQGAVEGAPVKPDPTLLWALMDRLGADRAHTLFVGDSDVDIRTARSGGLASCGVLWGFRSRRELEAEGAGVLISRPEELAQLVLSGARVTKTRLLGPEETGRAADILRTGGLVAVPTETVYGLAADAAQAGAVEGIYAAKGRPERKPLNVLVDGMGMAETVCRDIPPLAYDLARAFWPGPLTMILWGNGILPPVVNAGGATQGVRCPDHPVTLQLLTRLGRPLAAPSANLSGQPSPKSAAETISALGGRIDAVLDGGVCTVGVESTIVDLTVSPPRILRQGGLSRADLERVAGPLAETSSIRGCIP